MDQRDRFQTIMTTHKHLIKTLTKEWTAYDGEINQSQLFILKSLNRDGPQKISQLAEQICVTAAAVTCASEKLISDGYARRKGEEKDRRVVYLEISDKGKQLVEETMKKHEELTARVFHGLSDEDVNHLQRIFNHMLDNLSRLKS